MSLSFMDTLCSLLGGLETLYVLLWIKPSSWVPFIFDSQATSAVVSMFALALGCPHTSVCQVWCTSVSNGGSKDSRRSIRFILRLFKGWIAPLPHESNPYLQREYLTVKQHQPLFAIALGCPHTSVCQVWCTSVSNGGSKDSCMSIRFFKKLLMLNGERTKCLFVCFKVRIEPLPDEWNLH